MPDYNIYRLDRQTRRADQPNLIKKGGGLAVFVKSDIHVDDTIYANLNVSNQNIELQCLMLRPHSQKKYNLLNVYRPPSGNLQLFLDTIVEHLDQITSLDNSETFLMGDFNIDIGDQLNQNALSLIENLLHLGLIQKIASPTRHSKNSPSSTIDHIYTDSKCIHESGNITLNISDHDLVYTIRKKEKPEKTKMTFYGRSYRNYDVNIFQETLINQNWDAFYLIEEVNEAWSFLHEAIQNAIDAMCPLKNIKIKKKKDPWISNELLEFVNDKNDLLQIAKTTQSDEDWQAARIARNLVASLIKDAKRDYLTNEIENNHDPNKFWKKLHLMFPDKVTSGKIKLKDPLTHGEIDDHDIPNYANNFFTQIGSNIINETGFVLEDWDYGGTEFQSQFRLREIRIEDVLKEIKSIKISKPSGVENISTKIIRDSLWALGHQFTWLLNLSLRTAQIPISWKKAKVSLIPKDGDLTDINNFRPIAILPIMSKLMERLIHSQTMEYLEGNRILDVNQGGFRKNNSTTSTTSEMLDDIYRNINNQQLTYSVFIDFRKAFDSINHKILLKKLEKLGFHRDTIAWFENYLTDRTQYSVVNGLSSNLLGVPCGVPQGSVLGPMLFLLFINDLGSAIINCNYKLYADDTILYSNCSGDDNDVLTTNIQHDLDNVSTWCKLNAIMMNVKKTKTMMFGTRYKLSQQNQVELYVDNRLLECVPCYKYLGTFVDSEMNFIRQSNETIKSVSYEYYFLGKIKAFLNTNILLKLYKSYIQPYFDYNDIFLETTTFKQYDKLARLQRRCLKRCLPENMEVNRNNIFQSAGINKLCDRADTHLLKLMYKRAQNDLYLDHTEGRTRLHDAPVLDIPFPNNELFKKSIIFQGATAWNALPPHIRNIPTFECFKTKMKEHLSEILN